MNQQPSLTSLTNRPNTNAAKHGLYSGSMVIGDETPEAWRAFHEDLVASLNPFGTIETELASRAASLLWRLRRVPAAEAALTTRDRINVDIRDRGRAETAATLGPDSFYGKAFANPLPKLPALPIVEGPALLLVARYEAHLNRQLLHTLHELESLQARRAGKRTPLARVDVHGLPG